MGTGRTEIAVRDTALMGWAVRQRDGEIENPIAVGVRVDLAKGNELGSGGQFG
jgi:hypothetical protein